MARFENMPAWVNTLHAWATAHLINISRLLVLFGLMFLCSYFLDWGSNILVEADMYWQLNYAVTLLVFFRVRKMFYEKLAEKTTVIVVDGLFGNLFGERTASGPGVILVFPWENTNPDNIFTEETFSTGDISESVPGKDNLRGLVRGYITASLTRDGVKAYNQLGAEAKSLVKNYIDGLYREYVSAQIIADKKKKGVERFYTIPDLISRKHDLNIGLKKFLRENKAEEALREYGINFRDSLIKEVDFDEQTRAMLFERAKRSMTISGDMELQDAVFAQVQDTYGKGRKKLTPEQIHEFSDSLFAASSATGDGVTKKIVDVTGVQNGTLGTLAGAASALAEVVTPKPKGGK